MPGGCFPTTSRHGLWSTITFGLGVTMGPGNISMTCSGEMCASRPANRGSPVLGSSIVNPSRPRKKGGPRLRYVQKRQWPQTAYSRRYVRVAPGRGGHGRQCTRPRRGHAAAGGPPWQVFPTPADLGGSGLEWGTDHLAVGPAALAENPPGHCQTARRDQGLPAAAEALDCRADFRLVWPLPPVSKRLRIFDSHERSDDPRRHDSPDGPPPRSHDIFLNTL